MPWRALAALALIVVGVGAVFVAVFGPTLARSDTTQYITSRATTTNVVNDAVADGTLAAAQTYGLSYGADPRLVSSSSSASSASGTWLVKDVNVKVGQQVATGDVLATANSTDQQNALALAQASLAATQAKYDADTGGPTSTDQQSAQIGIDQAQQQLDTATKSRDDTSNQNAIKLSQAEDAVTQAQKPLRDDRSSSAPDTVITADKDALTQAQDNLQLTRSQVDASNTQARQQVASAQLALQSAQNNAQSQTAAASDETLASDKAALLQARADGRRRAEAGRRSGHPRTGERHGRRRQRRPGYDGTKW